MVRQGKGDGGVLSSTGIDDYLPNSKLITEAGKIIDIKSIREKGLLLEEIEEPGMD